RRGCRRMYEAEGGSRLGGTKAVNRFQSGGSLLPSRYVLLHRRRRRRPGFYVRFWLFPIHDADRNDHAITQQQQDRRQCELTETLDCISRERDVTEDDEEDTHP